MVRVGINGFGRMGRLAARFLIGRSNEVEIVHINENNTDAEGSAYLLEFDSVHGRYDKPIQVENGVILVDGEHRITYSSFGTPGEVPWSKYNVEVVMECSGQFNDIDKLQAYFECGVKRVVVSAPVKKAVNVVVGCNDHLITPKDKIVTAASCTTNCIAPVIKVMDELFGIKHGCINTIHNITNTQSVLDKPNVSKKDLRRARAGMINLAPTSTGSAKAVTMIFPHLEGKLDGLAIRVPLQNASITDLTLELNKEVTKEAVNKALKEAADDTILGFEERPLVSTDYVNDTRSSVVDAKSTIIVDNSLVKILCWYDNEFGYAKRLSEICEKVASQIAPDERN